mgnify:CR=1 FL=1
MNKFFLFKFYILVISIFGSLSSCKSSIESQRSKKILVTHHLVQDFIFWISDNEYDVVPIYKQDNDPFRENPNPLIENDFISFVTMCQKWETKALRVANEKRPKSFISMNDPRIDIDCSFGSPWLHGAYLSEYLYETASFLSRINPGKTEDYFKKAEVFSEEINDFTIQMRVVKTPELKLPQGLRVAIYSSFGYELLGYMGLAPYIKIATLPSDLVFPEDIALLAEDDFPPDLIIFTNYADPEIIKIFEDNGFGIATIKLFPSDFGENVSPIDFIKRNYEIIRTAMLNLSDF